MIYQPTNNVYNTVNIVVGSFRSGAEVDAAVDVVISAYGGG